MTAPRRTAARRTAAHRIPAMFAAMTVLGQISWVLVEDPWRTRLTVLTVVTFFCASATHALIHRGPRWAGGFLAVSLSIGLGVEILGTSTGFPFGEYAYAERLGPSIATVPVVIPLAWAMMAYPCLLAARLLTAHLTGSKPSPDGTAGASARAARLATPLAAAWTLACWDLFLDPQMVSEGHWAFTDPTPALPGSPGIPLGNYAGWLLTAIVLFAILDRLPTDRDGELPRDALPASLLGWTYASNVMAAAVFWGRPAVAVWGGLLMGLTVVPWARIVLTTMRSGVPR